MDLRDIKEFIKDSLKYICVIAIVLFIFVYVISIQQVMGPSMNDTFKETDVVLISKLSYRFKDIKRGDIIVFEYNEYKNLIKRVIGLPGDKIEYKDNVLYINDEAYKESYVNDTITEDFKYDKIPEGMYLVLGDNRDNSQDSRNFGPIEEEKIIGKVVMRIWPLNRIKIIK